MTTGTDSNDEGLKYRVLIVDDHPLVRRGMADLIAKEPDLEVCAQAGDPIEALRLVRETSPDVVLVDLSLSTGHGIDLIEQVRATGCSAKLLVISMHDERLFAERVLRAGAMGYVSKQEPADAFIHAIHRVLAGEVALSSGMESSVLNGIIDRPPPNQDPIHTLSNRELEVFELIGEGLRTKEIAVRLDLSHKTVESHRDKIRGKLHLANCAELVCRAIQWKMEKQ